MRTIRATLRVALGQIDHGGAFVETRYRGYERAPVGRLIGMGDELHSMHEIAFPPCFDRCDPVSAYALFLGRERVPFDLWPLGVELRMHDDDGQTVSISPRFATGYMRVHREALAAALERQRARRIARRIGARVE